MNFRPYLISLLLTVYATAQEPAFDGRIELRAPTRSSWTITFRPGKAMHVAETAKSRAATIEELPMSPDALAHVLKSLTVEKSDTLYFELSRFDDGTSSQKWSRGSIQFREIKNGSVLAMAAMNLLDPDFSDHRKEDFEELGWLSKEFYKGVITYQSQPCFLFQTTSDKRPATRREIAIKNFIEDPEYAEFKKSQTNATAVTAKPESAPVTVIVSAVTRLPLVYNDGKMLRTYSYNTTNLGPLVPPEKFAREFTAWHKQVDEMNRAPVAP